MAKFVLDRENDALTTFRLAFEQSERFQKEKLDEFERIYKRYKGHIDFSDKDPYLAYPVAPLAYAIIEGQVSRDIRAVFSKTPYIPIKSIKPEYRTAARDFSDALQCLLDLGDFVDKMIIADKYRRLYGLAYFEPTPVYESVKRLALRPSLLGMEEVEEEVKRFRLKFEVYAPWEVYRDPFARTLEDARWVIKLRLASKSELIRQAENGDFGDDFDISKLTEEDSTASTEMTKDWSTRMRQAVGLSLPEQDTDIGVYGRLETKDRYIDVWDFRAVLRDVENPFNHGRVNLAALINNFDPNPMMQFDGISELKVVEPMLDLLDSNLAQMQNNHNMQNHKVLAYDEEKVSVDTLVMRPGARVPVVNRLPNEPLLDAVQEIPVSPLSPDHYRVPAILERWIRVATSEFEADQGETTQRPTTATEAALLRQQSDSRKQLTISMFERSLKDIANLCLSHMHQFMETPDWADLLGDDRANAIQFTHPQQIPGGCTFSFTGADRASEQLVMRRELVDLMSVVGPNPMLEKKLLESYNFSNEELQAYFQIREQEQQAAQQAAQAQENRELELQANKKRIGGLINTENKIREVSLGLRALPGDDKKKIVQSTRQSRNGKVSQQ